MNSYEKFVTNYHKHTHCPRTLNEAYRTPEYACAITTFQTENKKASNVLFYVALIALVAFVVFAA